ncbi:MAG TPA: hypothetical protein ENI87_03950 [bacterium]|nr:hypothetical protein [bacterium]
MNARWKLPGVAALALSSCALVAQVQKGQTPPPIEFAKVWNDGPASFAELAGKVVILDFAATW